MLPLFPLINGVLIMSSESLISDDKKWFCNKWTRDIQGEKKEVSHFKKYVNLRQAEKYHPVHWKRPSLMGSSLNEWVSEIGAWKDELPKLQSKYHFPPTFTEDHLSTGHYNGLKGSETGPDFKRLITYKECVCMCVCTYLWIYTNKCNFSIYCQEREMEFSYW